MARVKLIKDSLRSVMEIYCSVCLEKMYQGFTGTQHLQWAYHVYNTSRCLNVGAGIFSKRLFFSDSLLQPLFGTTSRV